MNTTATLIPPAVLTGTVQLGKPWYLSKKLWLAVIGLALVVYQTITGKAPETLPEVLDHVAKIAGILGIIAPAILAIAHVDASERALILEAIGGLKDLSTPDPVPAAASVDVVPAIVPFDPTKSTPK